VGVRSHDVVLIPGDGTGPELTAAARTVLDAAAGAVGCRLRWDVRVAGAAALAEHGEPLPAGTAAALRDRGVGLKGQLSTPVGHGHRSVNLALRRDLDLYACLRPCRSHPGVPTGRSDVDLVVVRENVEDVYAGLESEPGEPAAIHALALLGSERGSRPPADAAVSVRPISPAGSERICRFAFDYASRHGYPNVTCATWRKGSALDPNSRPVRAPPPRWPGCSALLRRRVRHWRSGSGRRIGPAGCCVPRSTAPSASAPAGSPWSIRGTR
jgi:isocitrate dehydrogenase (NAD+)